jgi:hypothetical protein
MPIHRKLVLNIHRNPLYFSGQYNFPVNELAKKIEVVNPKIKEDSSSGGSTSNTDVFEI